MIKNAFKSAVPRRMVALTLAFAVMLSPMMGKVSAQSVPELSQDSTKSSIGYQIDVRLDEKTMTLHGSEIVTYRNTTKDDLQNIVFHTFADANRSPETQPRMFAKANKDMMKEHPDKKPEDFLGGIDIQKITSGDRALNFDNTKQALTVKLEQSLKSGEELMLKLDFDVKIPYGSQRLSYMKDIINGAHWFPVVSVYDEAKHTWNKNQYSTIFETDYYDMADYTVNMNVPGNYKVSMPGMITEKSAESGRKIVSAVANKTREFVFFASPNFKIASKTKDRLTIEYFYYDNQSNKQEIIDKYIDQAFKAIDFFSSKYGKYPYPEFRIVESYVQGVAVEFARVIQMGLIQGQPNVEANTVFVHEIAHQWFHSLIGNDSETESFLDEGFADFSKVYFSEKQGDLINGFKSIQSDEGSFDKVIGAPNNEVGELANPVYYGKGRQAIYELYRTVGEEKFDAFMKEYFSRYVYKNASIQGLLQTIEETLGKTARDQMDKAIHQPNYELKQEYRMTEEEQQAYFNEIVKGSYRDLFNGMPNLPVETMSRLMFKAVQGEPLTIIVGDKATAAAKKQQDKLVESLTEQFGFFGVKPEVISERKVVKQKLGKELAKSNIIVIGNPKSNAFVQALKGDVMKRANSIGFSWKEMMGKKDTSGGYIIKHPYNQNRLMLHYFWTGDQLSNAALQPFIAKAGMGTMNFTAHFYQFYVADKAGNMISEKKIENPLAKLFEQADE